MTTQPPPAQACISQVNQKKKKLANCTFTTWVPSISQGVQLDIPGIASEAAAEPPEQTKKGGWRGVESHELHAAGCVEHIRLECDFMLRLFHAQVPHKRHGDMGRDDE